MPLDFVNMLVNAIVVFYATKLIFDWLESRKEEKLDVVDFESVLLVTVESYEQSGQTYWLVYTLHDNEFIAQGNTEEEAIKNTMTRCPDKTIFRVAEN